MYKYIFIDSNFILRRNFSIIRKRGKFDYRDVIYSFLSSVFKLHRNLAKDSKIILGWDKSPYISSLTIPSLKSNRPHYTESNIDQLRSKLDSVSGEEKLKLEAQINELTSIVSVESEFLHAKNSLQSYLHNTRFHPLVFSGFECDQIASLIAKSAMDLDVEILLVSSDSDWEYLINPNVNLYKPSRDALYTPENSPKLKNYFSFLKEHNLKGCKLYNTGLIIELYGSSHNNIPPYPHRDVPFKDFYKVMSSGINDLRIKDFDLYYKYLNALDVRKYSDSLLTPVLNTIESILLNKYDYSNDENVSRYFGEVNCSRFTLDYSNLAGNPVESDLESLIWK